MINKHAAAILFILLCTTHEAGVDGKGNMALIQEVPQKPTKEAQSQAKELLTHIQRDTPSGLLEDVQAHARQLKAQGVKIATGKKKCVKPTLTDTRGPYEQEGEVLVFVSFSMPNQALKALAAEIHGRKARLILRGLHQDSFAQTKAKLDELGITVDIDPTLFNKYAITRVPTFVQQTKTTTKRVSGNLTFSYVTELFQGQSS